MVHSEVSTGMVRDPLGIPKSPSFHSGLDLAATAESVAAAMANGRAGVVGGGAVPVPANPPPLRDREAGAALHLQDDALQGLGQGAGAGPNGLNAGSVAGRQLSLLLGMLGCAFPTLICLISQLAGYLLCLVK